MEITNEERREVARKLRKLASENQGAIGSMCKMQEVLTQAKKITGTMNLPSVAHVLERYADLIDPQERTCKIEGTYDDEFGIYDHLTCGHVAMRQWPEPTNYCSICGAEVVE